MELEGRNLNIIYHAQARTHIDIISNPPQVCVTVTHTTKYFLAFSYLWASIYKIHIIT
nr:MAG TPA: hypothetical protein [Caudoviricetes sp.]